VSCTVNSQGWNSYLCLCRVTIKRKVSNCGYQRVIAAFTKDDESCHCFILRLFSSSSWSVAWKAECKRISMSHSTAKKEMISQQNEPSPTLQPVQKTKVNIVKDICQNILTLLLKEHLKISGTWKLQEIIPCADH